ncbi:ATP-binding protein [Sulfuracidifex metallicus]|uniref:DUF87 domain-containing protein n=2 Tax=Sulfuracidifex metallicus TaxID=47303 RepID=A0A6A9QJ72_SULME|nr:DUF87 domain-containing protein [Sulfuracidifex metallicus]MUN28280.1 DUF87 domain-containing protein [Sulfuracidifex metallicus DSM 6482 = JCM 9184]WOE51187.1 DUF87 domain-containing protein [Sulfuracidifex metallicus DSM 6482 = JCM 9184]
MLEERHVVFVAILISESIALTAIPDFFRGVQGITSYFFFFFVVLFLDAFSSVIVFYSPLTSLIYFLGVYSSFSIIGINLIDPIDLSVYLFGFSSASFILFISRRNFSDFLINMLSKHNVSKPTKGNLLILLFLTIIGYLVFFLLGFPFLAFGCVADFLAMVFSQKRIYPLIFMSWLSLPLALFSITSTSGSGINIGKVTKVLLKSSTSFRFRGNSYTWIKANQEFKVNLKESKNYNSVIVGSSGSGKSFLVKWIIRQLNVSFTIFDLHGEYPSEGAKKIDMSKVSVNPLSLNNTSPKKRSLEVAYMIKSIFNLGNLQTIDMFNLISETYFESGIEEEDPRTWNQKPPTFRDVLLYLERKKKLSTSTQDINRLSSLEPYLLFLSTEVFSRDSVNLEEIFEGNFVLDFSSVSANEIKYIMIETILRNLRDYMLRRGQSDFWKVFVLDEAPFVLSKETGRDIVERIFAEGRKFGIGMIVVSQSVEYVKKLMNNSASFFIFQLSEPNEVDYIVRFLAGDSEAYTLIHDTALSLQTGEFLTRSNRGDIFLVRIDVE